MAQFSSSRLHRDLACRGFYLCDYNKNVPLEAIASDLGHPVASNPYGRLVDRLFPKSVGDAQPGTLSSLFGCDAFPFHTETAYWHNPIDWLILRCINPGAGNRSTSLIDSRRLNFGGREIDQLTKSLMAVNHRSKSFLAPLARWNTDQLAFRYDPACMKPASKRNHTILHIFEQALTNAPRSDISWKFDQILIVDNKRMFHSRGKALAPDPDRCLERMYVVKVEVQ